MMDGVPIRKLLVRNFANRTTSKDLRNYFSKYGNVESCYLRGNRGKSNCAFVTFTNVADAVRAMQDGKQIRLHNRYLRVMAVRVQPDGMEQRSYNMGKESSKESNKASERRIANEQYSYKFLQNDTESVSIHMLNDDCLRHMFLFLPILDRVRIEIVCKRWRDLSQDSWHMLKTISGSKWGFSYTHKIHTDFLHKILLKCGRFLMHINLSNRHQCINLSQSTLNIIGKLCPNLTSINVTGLRVRPSSIRTLANNCRNIRKFTLGSCTDSCNNELKYFFKLNQNLEHVAIHGDSYYRDALLWLPKQTIHTIIIFSCNDFGNNHLSMALKRLKNLKHLTIIECRDITEHTLEVVGQHCKNLRSLVLGDYFGRNEMNVSNLIHFVNLQILRIPYNPYVSDDFLANLVKHCQQLTNLDFTGCDEVSDAGLAAVATLVNLEKLNVTLIYKITDNGLKIMRGLKELECGRCEFTDRGMSTFIKSSPQLQLLDLWGCKNITDTTLEVAKHACSNRTNNVMLKMIVKGTAILTIDQEKLPPLLRIVEIKRVSPYPGKNIYVHM